MSEKKIKILFVCMGNICRSPSAEGAFKAQARKRDIQDLFEVDSAGTHAYHVGEAPDKRMQASAKKYGVDLSRQAARQVNESDFSYYDYIVAMDLSNLSHLQSICPAKNQYKLSLLLNHLPQGQNQQVPDPYYEGRFDQVFETIDEACVFLLGKLIKKA